MARRRYEAPPEDGSPAPRESDDDEQPIIKPTTPNPKAKHRAPRQQNLLDSGEEKDPHGWLGRVVETIVAFDPEEMNERLKLELSLGSSGSSVATAELHDALERAQDNADDASALYVHAARTAAASDVDLRVIESALYQRASEQLEKEKADGDRKKAITAKDVQSYMDIHYTEEVRDIETKKEANKRAVDHFENRARLWRDRARTLEALAQSKARRGAYED